MASLIGQLAFPKDPAGQTNSGLIPQARPRLAEREGCPQIDLSRQEAGKVETVDNRPSTASSTTLLKNSKKKK